MSTDRLTNLATASDWWNPWTYPSYSQPAITYSVIQTPRCAWCQGTHTDKCPDLKAVIYRRDGTVERVEFFGEKD